MIRYAERFVAIINLLAGTLIAGIFIVMAIQVVSRYGFNASIFGQMTLPFGGSAGSSCWPVSASPGTGGMSMCQWCC